MDMPSIVVLDRPEDDDDAVEQHLSRLRIRGLTRVANAIDPHSLARCRSRFHSLIESDGRFRSKIPMAKEVQRIVERDECFASLMDLPSVFPVVDAWHNEEATLGDGGIAQNFFVHSRAQGGWHRDGGSWIRCTFLLNDLDECGGATAFITGTHLSQSGPPAEWNELDGQPREQPGMVLGVGRAGDCIINVTSIWHTNTPNRSAVERHLIWLLYKPKGVPGWDTSGLGYAISPEFAASQRKPLRARLCGRVADED